MTRRAFLHSAAALLPASRRNRDFARRIYTRINELRVIRGAGGLVWSEVLASCATEQSERKQKLHFAGHDDPERGDIAARLTTAGVRWIRCGENLFEMRGYDDPVNFAVVFWWYSAGHQENLLNPEYTETGVGIAQGPDETFYVTQIFSTPAPPGVHIIR